MYNNMSMPPPWMWGGFPGFNQPPQTPSQDPVTMITGWIKGLEELKKSMKEEKKDDPKKANRPNASVVSMMLLMLLLSPITGPSMYYFFQLSLGILHK